MDLKLTGKNALITGSSRGLGFAVAKTLSAEGAHVAINARNDNSLSQAISALEESNGPSFVSIAADVTKHAAADTLIKRTVDAFGGLDILVTNSGGPPVGAFEKFDDETWQSSLELSFLSHVRLIRSALPYLRKSSSASVLAITSYSAKHPLNNLILSNSIRLATIGLIKTLSLELSHEGIRFNAILPGWTKTERVHNIMDARAEINQTTKEFEFEQQANAIPMKRMATPQEFANTAAFLVSPAASYVNGVMLQVDGGATRGIL